MSHHVYGRPTLFKDHGTLLKQCLNCGSATQLDFAPGRIPESLSFPHVIRYEYDGSGNMLRELASCPNSC